MDDVITIIKDGSIALAVLVYFMYRDNKYTSTIVENITKFQGDIEQLTHTIEQHLFKKGE